MFQKLLEIFVKRVLWPLLRTIVELVLIQAAQWIFDKIRELLHKWRREEETSAASEEERDIIHRKYERRESDLTSVEREIPDKMREIAQDAFLAADKQTHQLLKNSGKEPLAIPTKLAKKPRARKRSPNDSKTKPKARNA